MRGDALFGREAPLVGRQGLEPWTNGLKTPQAEGEARKNEENDSSLVRSDVATGSGGAIAGQSDVPVDAVEEALAEALRGATAAGQWETVTTLARELQARREARAGVVQLGAERNKRGLK